MARPYCNMCLFSITATTSKKNLILKHFKQSASFDIMFNGDKQSDLLKLIESTLILLKSRARICHPHGIMGKKNIRSVNIYRTLFQENLSFAGGRRRSKMKAPSSKSPWYVHHSPPIQRNLGGESKAGEEASLGLSGSKENLALYKDH